MGRMKPVQSHRKWQICKPIHQHTSLLSIKSFHRNSLDRSPRPAGMEGATGHSSRLFSGFSIIDRDCNTKFETPCNLQHPSLAIRQSMKGLDDRSRHLWSNPDDCRDRQRIRAVDCDNRVDVGCWYLFFFPCLEVGESHFAGGRGGSVAFCSWCRPRN